MAGINTRRLWVLILCGILRRNDLGRNCPGFFMLMSNHIPNAIPKENIEYYFEVFEKLRRR
jgi:hypothetical protein